MRIRDFYLLTAVILLNFTGLSASTVRLNEIMASNSLTNQDQDGDSEDWIELYNYGTQTVDLSGWFLSDDYEELDMWEFPSVAIQPNGYLIIWASNKDRYQGELHTNFAIASAGEEVLLVSPEREIFDELPPTNIPTDISVGRVGSDNETWYFFDDPTPNRANSNSYYNGIAQPPVFSVKGGIYNSNFSLTLTTDNPSGTIYYTTDGSKPSTNLSPVNYNVTNTTQRNYRSQQYSSSISIQDRTGRSNSLHTIQTTAGTAFGGGSGAVSPSQDPLTGTVVRARTYADGYLPSEIVTHTYIIKNSDYNVPVISLSFPEPYFFGYDEGIYVPGSTAGGGWFASGGNYNERGREWEREVNFEMFSPNGNTVINQISGARVHGGYTRNNPQKSIRLYARNSYSNSEFEYQFFPTKKTNKFKRILLRMSGQDDEWTFFRDALMQMLIVDRGLDIQHWQPAVTFLNGEYWGILNIRDRIDRYMLHYDHGVDPDNLDMISGSFQNYEVSQGDDNHYRQMINYASNNDLSQSHHYNHLKTMVDIDNFAEYFAFQIYCNNTDWPGNNIDFWRLRTEYDSDAPYGHDGRWRWIVFDMDFGFGGISYVGGMMGGRDGAAGPGHNTLDYATDPSGSTTWNAEWSTRLLRNLLDNTDFRNNFVNRFADLMNHNFYPDTVENKIDQMQSVYTHIIDDHIARWGRIPSRNQWNQEIDIMRNFARQRPAYMKQHIESKFNLSGTSNITVRVGEGRGDIRVSTLDLRDLGSWTGTYFNGVPVSIEAIADYNNEFSHWEGEINSQEELVEVVLSGRDVELTAHFVEDRTNPIIHYWHFNDLLGAVENNRIDADFSATGTARVMYSGTSDGYMDDVSGSNNNIRMDKEDGRGLRVRNPSENRSLIIEAPTTGFEHIVFSYAVRRTSNGAETQTVSYSTNNGSSWTLLGDNINIDEDYETKVFDLRDISQVNNNSQLQFKIEFAGDNISLESGNNRFDNIVIEMLDPSIPVVDVITAVEERKSENWEISIGPNPIQNRLFVYIDNPNHYHVGSRVEVVIRDINARVTETAFVNIEKIGENISSQIDISHLKSGVYIVDLIENGKRVRQTAFTKIRKK